MLDTAGIEHVGAGKFAAENQHRLANDSRNLTPAVRYAGKKALIDTLEIGRREQTRLRFLLRESGRSSCLSSSSVMARLVLNISSFAGAKKLFPPLARLILHSLPVSVLKGFSPPFCVSAVKILVFL